MRMEDLQERLKHAHEPYVRRFHALMAHRVKTILMVSTSYEAFSLAWDGSLAEDIYGTFSLLHLQNVPEITTVTSGREALELLARERFDLVLVSSNLADMDPAEFGLEAKRMKLQAPVVMLVFAGGEHAATFDPGRRPGIDHVFSWQGSTKVLLSIIKLIEDRLNVDQDIQIVRIGVIVVVEDSVRQYSRFLPSLYAILMRQAFARVPFGVDENERQLFTRTRPKILLARTFSEAAGLVSRYRPFLHGVISDFRIAAEEQSDPDGGARFLKSLVESCPGLPVLLISADEAAPAAARELKISFADKNSPLFAVQLEDFCAGELGFGDFVFRDSNGRELDRARNLREFENALRRIPEEALEFMSRRNQFSHWLLAQGESTLAEVIRPMQPSDFSSLGEMRAFLVAALEIVRREKRRGIISDFRADDFEADYGFLMTGHGSLGGKGRGLAFMFHMLNRRFRDNRIAGVEIRFPRTLVITTDSFGEFMGANDLYSFAVKTDDDEAIRTRFLAAGLPGRLRENLSAYISTVRVPLAVRSSSHMEDSSCQPFAGIYSTIMLPNSHADNERRLEQLETSVKLVYASMYTNSIKRYFRTLGLNLEDEKMAVVVQELAGRRYGTLFYPAVSGVAQSLNYYPIDRMEAGDGVASVALGFGKMVMEGGEVMRFCPQHPNLLPQASTPSDMLQVSQKQFYAIDLAQPEVDLAAGGGASLRLYDLARAERDSTLQFVGSVVSKADDMIVEDLSAPGVRVVSFAPILRHGAFPLSNILAGLLKLGKESLGGEVEIEFAVNIDADRTRPPEFYLLQIRPMVTARAQNRIEKEVLAPERILCVSRKIMGNGVRRDICDIVYCHPRRFDFQRTRRVAEVVGRLNQALLEEGRSYVLIGPGRWGTRVLSLGVPVNWQQVAGAAAIVETEAPGRNIDPSQGAHFFHNISATGIGYFSIPRTDPENHVCWERLEALPAAFEEEGVRHVRLDRPATLYMNALDRQGAVLMNPSGQSARRTHGAAG